MNISAIIFSGVGILVCVALSAFFSAAEMAISSCNTVRLENEAKEGKKGSERALKLNRKYDDTLSAILVGNNLVNIAASALGTVFILYLTGSDRLNWVVTVVVTILIIIFGETVPKIISKKHANAMASNVSGIIQLLIYLFKPLNLIVVGLTNLITCKIHEKEQDEDEAEDEAQEELQAIIETAEDEGVLDSDRSDLVAAAIDFPDVSASDVMTARVDVEAIDINDDPEEILKTVLNSSRSRMPVYEDSIDNVIGVIHQNHLLKAMSEDINCDIRSIMLEPCFVYRTAKLPHVLNVLRKARQHLAIVTDEFSGTLGVVSMEDVLEQLVGDIWDETDTVEEEIVEKDSGELIIDADMPIGDFIELLGISEDDWDYESITAGGWTIEYTGDFPKQGDEFEYDGNKIIVAEMDGRRVVKLRVIRKAAEEEPSEDEKVEEQTATEE